MGHPATVAPFFYLRLLENRTENVTLAHRLCRFGVVCPRFNPTSEKSARLPLPRAIREHGRWGTGKGGKNPNQGNRYAPKEGMENRRTPLGA